MPFEFVKLDIPDLILVKPKVFQDSRGFFIESYKYSEFAKNGIDTVFVQDNHSRSLEGVIRGLHFQLAPSSQAKLIRCIRGKILDVSLDIRTESETFGKWTAVELSEENKNFLYIPEGFAHGFSVLSKEAEIFYKTSKEYAPGLDSGIRWDDSELEIDWKVETPVISPKDKTLQTFQEYKKSLRVKI